MSVNLHNYFCSLFNVSIVNYVTCGSLFSSDWTRVAPYLGLLSKCKVYTKDISYHVRASKEGCFIIFINHLEYASTQRVHIGRVSTAPHVGSGAPLFSSWLKGQRKRAGPSPYPKHALRPRTSRLQDTGCRQRMRWSHHIPGTPMGAIRRLGAGWVIRELLKLQKKKVPHLLSLNIQ